jgi:hypothetical protein
MWLPGLGDLRKGPQHVAHIMNHASTLQVRSSAYGTGSPTCTWDGKRADT